MITPNKEFWEVFKNTDGALSCTEAIAIMNIAAQAPEGNNLELGVYKGKSAISALQGLISDNFTLCEPEFKDDLFLNEVITTIRKLNSDIKPRWTKDYSYDAIQSFTELSYVFVDSGSHQDGLPMQEVKLLEDRMIQGGIIAFHDFDSQFKEVREAADYLVSTGKYKYIPINWEEIIEYVNDNNLEEGNKSWHHTELRNPCFVGAVKRI